jgi:hypothetical protein
MSERVNLSPFLGVSLTLLFIFSTLYTLAFYYYQGAGQDVSLSTPSDSTGSLVSGFDALFNAVSWLSPFGFIKALLLVVMSGTPEFYQILDMLLLRPIGWFVFLVQANYLLSLVPTIGKGE